MSDSDDSPEIKKVKRRRKVAMSDSEDDFSPNDYVLPKKSRFSRKIPSEENKTHRSHMSEAKSRVGKQDIAKEKRDQDKRKKMEEQQAWKCAWCGVGWEQGGKKAVKQDESELVGSLCSKCGVRFQKGKGEPQMSAEGFQCECRRVFPTYKGLIEHEKRCEKDAEVEMQLYVLSRPLSSQASKAIIVKKNIMLEDFVTQVRIGVLGSDGMAVCLYGAVDSDERGAKLIDNPKALKLALQEQKVYVQVCLYRLDASVDVKWKEGACPESLDEGPSGLQMLAVWRGQEFRKAPALMFPSTWASGPNSLPYDWGVFADSGIDFDFSDYEAMKLAGRMIHAPAKPLLLYFRGTPLTWNKEIFQNELIWLRNCLSPFLNVLVEDSKNKNNIYNLFIVLPVSVLVTNANGKSVSELKNILFVGGQENNVEMNVFSTCMPQDNQIFSHSNTNNSNSNKNKDNFLVVQITVNEGEDINGDDEEYAMSLAAHLQDLEAPISLQTLEKECPPPEGLSTREIITERPTMFTLTKKTHSSDCEDTKDNNNYDDNFDDFDNSKNNGGENAKSKQQKQRITPPEDIMVGLANITADESEPEENLDWAPEDHSEYEDDESDLKDIVLPPEGSALLQFAKGYLNDNGVPPSPNDFRHSFRSFAVGRSESLIKELVGIAEKHKHWYTGPHARMEPGQINFNAHAHRSMLEAGVNQPEHEFQIHAPQAGEVTRLQPYQKTVSFLVHPFSPVQRMLVVHRTGAGKTLSMIRILDNFFHDPRPKIVVFPTETVANNFYLEILKFPNAFRAFVEQEVPKITNPSLSQHAKMVLCRDTLMMGGVFVKGKMRKRYRLERENKLVPAAPVRSYSYMRAGGQTVVALDKKKQPRNALVKVMWDNEGRNPYTNKICLMDEIHNMTTEKTQFANWKDKLVALQKMLSSAKNATVVGFTATPVQEQAKEAETLLAVIKGQRTDNHEGYVSFFHSAPTTVFPAVTPRGVPEIAMPEAVAVPLRGQNLNVYAAKHSELTKQKLAEQHFVARMTNYCSLGAFYTRACMAQEKKFLLEESEGFACKLYKIALDVIKEWETHGGKMVVMLHRTNGWKAMALLLSHMCKSREEEGSKPLKCASYPPCLPNERGFSSQEVLQNFNHCDNDLGHQVGVLIVDAKEAGEGVSLLSVRRLYLGDTPRSWLEYQQRVGRAVRFCGHQRLDVGHRNLHVKLYLTTVPGGGRQCAFAGCPNTDYTPEIIEALPDEAEPIPPAGSAKPETPRSFDPQLKCATCSKWFCCPEHWSEGHPPCRGRNRMIDERVGLETADQLLYRRLKQAFAAGSPLVELKRIAVDGEILRPTLGDFGNSFDAQVNNNPDDTSVLFVPRPPSSPRKFVPPCESKTSSKNSADDPLPSQTKKKSASSKQKSAPKRGVTKRGRSQVDVDSPKVIPVHMLPSLSPPKKGPSAPGGPCGAPSPYQASDYEHSD